MESTVTLHGNEFQTLPHNSEILGRLRHLIEISPYDSNASVKIMRTKLGYLGVLKIFSSEGIFKARAYRNDAENVFRALIRSANKKLSRWKSRRHFDEAEISS